MLSLRSLTNFIIIFSAAISLGSTECHRGWFHFENSCYFFSTTYRTWASAASFCSAYNSRLAVVESQAEDNFLSDVINRLISGIGRRAVERSGDFWIGATDEMTEGRWEWIPNGTPLNYTNWSNGQPDNWLSDENCLEIVLWASARGKWNDRQCSAERHFICEMEFPSAGNIIG